jgi:DNA-binding winged helix-turn-helix (wHTH) protein
MGRQWGVLATASIFEFEEFRLDRHREGMSRRDEHGVFVPLPIGPRALEVLSVLVERAGQLVTKEEIMAAVWRRSVVENANLTVQISTLRRVLDQGRSEGSCIQTVAVRGYRLVVPVTRIETADTPSMAAASVAGAPRAAPRLSIVVLLFTDLSEDRRQQYFADGMTDDLTTDLSRLSGMFVIAHLPGQADWRQADRPRTRGAVRVGGQRPRAGQPSPRQQSAHRFRNRGPSLGRTVRQHRK